jgi:hypothetical protein
MENEGYQIQDFQAVAAQVYQVQGELKSGSTRGEAAGCDDQVWRRQSEQRELRRNEARDGGQEVDKGLEPGILFQTAFAHIDDVIQKRVSLTSTFRAVGIQNSFDDHPRKG